MLGGSPALLGACEFCQSGLGEGGDGFFGGWEQAKDFVHAGELEHVRDGVFGTGEDELIVGAHGFEAADEGAEACRVDELDLAEVEDNDVMALGDVADHAFLELGGDVGNDAAFEDFDDEDFSFGAIFKLHGILRF